MASVNFDDYTEDGVVDAAYILLLILKKKRIGNKTITNLSFKILNYLYKNNNSYENIIREHFHNNPNTSKALRLLVTNKIISRSGVGGRLDPYIYFIS
jgi:hypothetical protein